MESSRRSRASSTHQSNPRSHLPHQSGCADLPRRVGWISGPLHSGQAGETSGAWFDTLGRLLFNLVDDIA